MSTRYAFIGAGNMAKAMIGGILSSGLAEPNCVLASNPSAPKLDALKKNSAFKPFSRTTQQWQHKLMSLFFLSNRISTKR